MTDLNLKVGDKVFVCSRFGKKLATVDKITPNGFVKVNDRLFYPSGTERSGDNWNRSYLIPATEETIEDFKKKLFIQRCIKDCHNLKELTYAQAVAIEKILMREEIDNG